MTKELLDITTWHAFGEEVVGAIFIHGNGKVVPGCSRWALPKAADKVTKRSTKANKRGPKRHPNGSQLLLAVRREQRQGGR
jgi:hypothetical protein